MAKEIIWTEKAKTDLKKIIEFIAQDSIKFAEIQLDKILNSVKKLSDFPNQGRILPEFPKTNYREIILGNYRIIYREFNSTKLVILALVHARRILKEELLELRID